MSYAIFRSQPINTLNDLSQIGSHNKRDKQSYASNPDINKELSKNNIELVPCNTKYTHKFYEITKEYKKEHDERMKTVREDRKKSFSRAVNDSRSVVADELLFTSDKAFFEGMSIDEIKRWANTCMDFVYNDLGYTKEQVIHSTIHLDEKTPHIHCVVVPLIKKYDKRTNSERYSISKKQYIKNKEHLSLLQDKYYERLINANFDLQRGIKNSDNEHIPIKDYKRITRNLDKKLERDTSILNDSYNKLSNKLKNSKTTIIGNQIKIDKDTYDELNDFMKTTKKIIDETPKNKALFNELKDYTSSFRTLKQDNRNLKYDIENFKYEINKLTTELDNINSKYNNLYNIAMELLSTIKELFKIILGLDTNQKYNDKIKSKLDNYYNKKIISKNDLYNITKGTNLEKDYKFARNIDYEI